MVLNGCSLLLVQNTNSERLTMQILCHGRQMYVAAAFLLHKILCYIPQRQVATVFKQYCANIFAWPKNQFL